MSFYLSYNNYFGNLPPLCLADSPNYNNSSANTGHTKQDESYWIPIMKFLNSPSLPIPEPIWGNNNESKSYLTSNHQLLMSWIMIHSNNPIILIQSPQKDIEEYWVFMLVLILWCLFSFCLGSQLVMNIPDIHQYLWGIFLVWSCRMLRDYAVPSTETGSPTSKAEAPALCIISPVLRFTFDISYQL